MNDEVEPNLLQRIVSGCIVFLFACAPLYIGGVLLFGLVSGKEPVNLDIFIGMALTLVIAYPLLVLSYRLFSGRGRKHDGGLVSPYVLLVMSMLFVIMGGAILLFNTSGNVLLSIAGGLGFIVTGISGIAMSIKRIKKYQE